MERIIMEELIVIEVKETVLPNSWLTAAQCREMAESWKEEELISCIDSIMTAISHAASNGNLSAHVSVKTDRPGHFYEALKEKLNSLGYRVIMPNDPNSKIYSTLSWGIYW